MLSPEDLAFEKELQRFRNRLESASLLNIIKTQFKKLMSARSSPDKIEDLIEDSPQAEEEDLSLMSASKKRKIKKKAKQLAEQ